MLFTREDTNTNLEKYINNVSKDIDTGLQHVPNHIFDDLNISKLNKETQEAIMGLRDRIDIQSSLSILDFGSEASSEFVEFGSIVLESFSARDIPNIMELIPAMEEAFGGISKQAIVPKHGILGFFSDRSISTAEFIGKYNTAADIVNSIKKKLTQIDFELLRDIEIDKQFGIEVLKLIRNLEYHIIAAKIAIRDLRSLLDEYSCQSPLEQTSLSSYYQIELKDNLDRLERKVYNLGVQKTEAVQTLPILNQMIKSSECLSEQVKTTIQQGIPTWEKSIIISIHLYRQQNAIKSEKALRDMTNNLIKHNASMLKDNCESVAKAINRGLIDIETLQSANETIIKSTKSLNEIMVDGARSRAEQLVRLNNLQDSIKASLVGGV